MPINQELVVLLLLLNINTPAIVAIGNHQVLNISPTTNSVVKLIGFQSLNML